MRPPPTSEPGTAAAPLQLWELLAAVFLFSICFAISSKWRTSSDYMGEMNALEWFKLGVMFYPLVISPFIVTDFLLKEQARFRGRDRLALLFAAGIGWLALWFELNRFHFEGLQALLIGLMLGNLGLTIYSLATVREWGAPARAGWIWIVPSVPAGFLIAFLLEVIL